MPDSNIVLSQRLGWSHAALRVYMASPSGRMTQKAEMLYRRRFLERWLSEKWVRPAGRGKYEITEYGDVVVGVF